MFNLFEGYIDELVEETVKLCQEASDFTSIFELSHVPQPLCSDYSRPDKEVAIRQHRSRFAAQRVDEQV